MLDLRVKCEVGHDCNVSISCVLCMTHFSFLPSAHFFSSSSWIARLPRNNAFSSLIFSKIVF
jgi:hypothetical protein